MRELNELVGQTSKFELQSIITVHAKVTIVQNYHFEIGGEEAPARSICVEFEHLRRFGRLPLKKRTYEKIQGASNSGRLAKKPKLAVHKLSMMLCPRMGLPRSLPLDEPTSETPSETPANTPTTGKSAMSGLSIDESPINHPNTAEALKASGTAEPIHQDRSLKPTVRPNSP